MSLQPEHCHCLCSRSPGIIGTSKQEVSLEASEYARRIVDVAVDRQASDVLLLDISQVSSFADFFVIMSAESGRQIGTLLEEISREVEQMGAPYLRHEGTPDSGWVLLDCGDVVVHIFSADQRDLYRLEQVWSRAKPLLRIQ